MAYTHSNIFHFFFSLPGFGRHKISQQDKKYGPVAGQLDAQYRVSNVFTSDSFTYSMPHPDINAIACFRGQVFAQFNKNNTAINLVLKPFEQSNLNFTPIKYLIYRGLQIDSFIHNITDLTLIENDDTNSELLNRMYADWDNSSADLPVESLGLHLNSSVFNDSEMLDKVFEMQDDDFQLPIIPAGCELGMFDTSGGNTWGLDIVLDEFTNYPQLEDVRQIENIIDVTPVPVPPDKETLDFYYRREKILFYMDIAAYLNMHIHADLDVRVKVEYDFQVMGGVDIYNYLSTYFDTKDRFYIDIRNEHAHSMNFYNDKPEGPEGYAKLKLSIKDTREKLVLSDPENYMSDSLFLANPPEIEYHTSGWPILIYDLSDPSFVWDNTGLQKRRYFMNLRLPKSEFTNNSIFNVEERVDDDMDDENVDRLLTNTFQFLFTEDVYDGYYRTVRYRFNKFELTSDNFKPIGTYVNIHFTKDEDLVSRYDEDENVPAPEEKYRIKQLHVLDGIFSPLAIYASWKTDSGTIPPPPTPMAGQYIIRWKLAPGQKYFGWMRRQMTHIAVMQGVANDHIGEVAFAVQSEAEHFLPNEYKRHYPVHRGALQDLYMSGSRFLSDGRTFYHAYNKIQDWFFDYSSYAEKLYGNDEFFRMYTPPTFSFKDVAVEFEDPDTNDTVTMTLKNPLSGPDDFIGFPTGNLISLAYTFDEKQDILDLVSSSSFTTAVPVYYVASDYQVLDNALDTSHPVYRLKLGIRGLKLNEAMTDFLVDTQETEIILYSYDAVTYMTEDYMFQI